MTTVTKTVSPSVLRIWHGSGNIIDVPAERIADMRGTTLEALQRIATEIVRDPDLQRTLRHENLVLQRISESDDPDPVRQETMSPKEDFAKIADKCRTETQNISASVRHEGGSR